MIQNSITCLQAVSCACDAWHDRVNISCLALWPVHNRYLKISVIPLHEHKVQEKSRRAVGPTVVHITIQIYQLEAYVHMLCQR